MEYLYVKTSGKKRLDKNTYTLEQVTNPSFKDDYGRIVPPGYIVFDFDEQPYISIIHKLIMASSLKCKMLKTTKGLHFMFKTTLNQAKDHIKEFNWIGLKCDVKACGTKETKQSYQSIRMNGVTREETLINTESDDDLDYAPRWLYVIEKKKDQEDLTKDQTGGRNNLFHSQLMIKAKKAGFSYEEYTVMCDMIKSYVLTSPLEQEELNTAIRPEEWDNLELGEDKITIIKQAEDLINYWGCIIGGDFLAFYDNRIDRYSTDENSLKAYMQQKYASKNMSIWQMEEVINQVNVMLNDNKAKYQYDRNDEYVLCGRNLVSFWKDDIKPNTRTVYTDIYYPFEIMTQEEFDSFDGRMVSFLDEISCGNPDIKKVILESVGCMLSPSKSFGKIFIWYGNGANGKSLLLDLIDRIMGDKMTHANILGINDKFALEQVVGGVCNVTDDVGITTLKETGLLKTLTQGSSIEVHRKFKQSIKWKPNSQFVMCCNEIPRINDTTKGMIRRLVFVPFNMQLDPDKLDILLYQKICADANNLRYLLTASVFAYRNAVKVGHLHRLEKQDELEQDFIAENQDPIQSFFQYMVEEYRGVTGLCRYLDGRTTDEIYSNYKKWCEDMSIKPELPKTFTRNFGKTLPASMTKKVMSVGGAKFNCYKYTEP